MSRWHQSRRTKASCGAGSSPSSSMEMRMDRSDASATMSSVAYDETSQIRASSIGNQQQGTPPSDDDEESLDDDLPGAYALSSTHPGRESYGDVSTGWDPTVPASSPPLIGVEHVDRSSSSISILHDDETETDDAEVEDIGTPKKKRWTKRGYLLLGGIAMVCLAVGLAATLLVATALKDEVTAESSIYSEACNDADIDISSDPFLQCKCFGRIEIVDYDVQEYYNSLKAYEEMTDHFNQDIQVNSCAPQNVALVWVATEATVLEGASEGPSFEQILIRFALACLFASGDGRRWKNKSRWLSDEHECFWYGVQCDTENRIVSLTLPANNVQGTLESRIGLLHDLKSVDFAHNDVTGSIPMELWELPYLEELLLGGNTIIGTLPTRLGRYSSLKIISLYKNELTGTFPSLFGLSNLKELLLSETQLTGTLPANDLASFGQLEILDLSAIVALSGSLPLSFRSLTSLRVLNIESTRVAGYLPETIGNMTTSLETFRASYSRQQGSIPTTVGYLTNLVDLRVVVSYITGILPSELGRCTSLEKVDFTSNTLQGALPSEISNLSLLKHLSVLNNNGISGTVPAEWGELEELKLLNVAYTQITGSIPVEICDQGGHVTVGSKCQGGIFAGPKCTEYPDCLCCEISSAGGN